MEFDKYPIKHKRTMKKSAFEKFYDAVSNFLFGNKTDIFRY